MLINDYYVNAEQNNLDPRRRAGRLMLRGALEYDQDIDMWWDQVDDDGHR